MIRVVLSPREADQLLDELAGRPLIIKDVQTNHAGEMVLELVPSYMHEMVPPVPLEEL